MASGVVANHYGLEAAVKVRSTQIVPWAAPRRLEPRSSGMGFGTKKGSSETTDAGGMSGALAGEVVVKVAMADSDFDEAIGRMVAAVTMAAVKVVAALVVARCEQPEVG
ncbi:hypothetical protein NL676_026438 [Syzygium grande]|nr:hypothetical protein NL676_026438 [Syzygium grande]